MSPQPETPRDHPTLAQYPDSPTALVRDDDGVLWRVPVDRGGDEAVLVPVQDLVQARGAVAIVDLQPEAAAMAHWSLPQFSFFCACQHGLNGSCNVKVRF